MKISTFINITLPFFFLFLLSSEAFINCAHLESVSSFKSNYKLEKSKKKHREIPSLYQTWVKYIKFPSNPKEIPHSFFKNPSYESQVAESFLNKKRGMKKQNDLSSTIPSQKHFFAVVLPETINLLETKSNGLKTTYDSLPFDFIKPIPEDNAYNGGVSDKGKLNEGYCMQIHTIKPKQLNPKSNSEVEGNDEEWILCTDSETAHHDLMKAIIQQKIKIQKDNGIVYSSMKANPDDNISDEEYNDPNRNDNDGYWIVYQDWTQCSVKCGGGKQFKQLMCVPPKGNGKPCEGEPVRTRPCNTQPCPQPKNIDQLLNKKENINSLIMKNDTIVKVVPITNKPQRYDKCVIMERDALLVKEEEQSTLMGANIEKVKIPVRVVMNAKSIIAYTDSEYKAAVKTLSLESTKAYRIKNSNSCVVLQDNHAKMEICQLDCTGTERGFVDEWEREVKTFRDVCSSKRETVDADMSELNSKISQLKSQFEYANQQKMKEKTTNDEITKMSSKLEETERAAQFAIVKMKKLEKLLEEEEEAKEKKDLELLQHQIEEEKKKSNCITTSLKEKELAEKVQIGQQQINLKVEEMREKTKLKIKELMEEAKEKIRMKRLLNERKVRNLRTQIQKIRDETTSKLENSSKKGDMNRCFIATKQNFALVETYCGTLQDAEPQKIVDCRDINSFCFACCENEFGESFPDLREMCYTERCNPSSKFNKSQKTCTNSTISS